MRVNIGKVRQIIANAARLCDPDDPQNRGPRADFGALVYADDGTTLHAALQDADAELDKIGTDEIYHYDD